MILINITTLSFVLLIFGNLTGVHPIRNVPKSSKHFWLSESKFLQEILVQEKQKNWLRSLSSWWPARNTTLVCKGCIWHCIPITPWSVLTDHWIFRTLVWSFDIKLREIWCCNKHSQGNGSSGEIWNKVRWRSDSSIWHLSGTCRNHHQRLWLKYWAQALNRQQLLGGTCHAI